MVSSFLDDVIMGPECRIGMCQQCCIVDVSRPFFFGPLISHFVVILE